MVGLWRMESKKPDCAFCKIQANTYCDKTGKPVCSKCSTVVPVSSSVSDSLIQIMAKKHAPKKHIGKCIEASLSRGENYEF